MFKLPLIVWSGGVDSTALVINHMSNSIPFETVYVKLPNNEKRQKQELAARKRILKKLTDLYGNYHIKDHVLEYIGLLHNVNNELNQPFMWATSVSFFLNLSEYKEVQFGYIREDDFWHIRREFEELLNSAQRVLRPSSKLDIVCEYPLEWGTKEAVISDYYHFNDKVKPILDLTFYCENTKTKIQCGKCKKCIEVHNAMDKISDREVKTKQSNQRGNQNDK